MRKVYLLDFHVVPTRNIDFVLTSKGHRLVNCSLTGGWPFYYTMDQSKNLTYITKEEIAGPYDFDKFERLSKRFLLEEQLHQPDYFYCAFPPQLFHLFNKCTAPTIMHLFFRLEGHRRVTKKDFDKIIEMVLQRIDNKQIYPYTASYYDAAYFKYFTGREVPFLPVTCGYVNHLTWDINKVQTDEFLIFDGKRNRYLDHQRIIDDYVQWFDEHADIKLATSPLLKYPVGFDKLKYWLTREGLGKLRYKLYGGHIKLKLAHHGYIQSSLLHYKAIVFFPYSVFSGTMLECLKMGIPLFFPSQKLMRELHRQYHILPERTSRLLEKTGGKFSTVAYGKHLMPDPNDDLDLDAAYYWLDRCEWFRWKVRYFDSPQDLYEQLKNADFLAMHHDVKNTWAEMNTQSEKLWTQLLKA